MQMCVYIRNKPQKTHSQKYFLRKIILHLILYYKTCLKKISFRSIKYLKDYGCKRIAIFSYFGIEAFFTSVTDSQEKIVETICFSFSSKFYNRIWIMGAVGDIFKNDINNHNYTQFVILWCIVEQTCLVRVEYFYAQTHTHTQTNCTYL